MRLVSAAEMREMDRLAVEEFLIPEAVLMEAAGRGVAGVGLEMLRGAAGRRVLVLVHTGHNGGDGLVAARHLAEAGATVRVVRFGDPGRMDELVRREATILERLGIRVEEGEGFPLAEELVGTDLVVDALLGTGAKGAPREELARVIETVNSSGRPVLAVDIPSGLGTDDGRAEGPVIRAAATVTFELGKVGLYLSPGRELAGRVHVVPIGIPAAAIRRVPENCRRTEAAEVRALLPVRRATDHKGSHGSLLLVAGSRGMMGAAILAARGALRSGVGLVHLAVPDGERPTVVAAVPEAITHGLPEERGELGPAAAERLTELASSVRAVAIGPGLGRGEGTARVVDAVWRLEKPVLFDADALNLLASGPWPRSRVAPTLITPHPGEMGRLMGAEASLVDARRVELARAAAEKWGLVVLLKGSPTVIAAPGEAVRLNPTGHPDLGVGGSGDVLTGLAGGLMAQGLDPFAAAVAGAFWHGLAGEVWAHENSDRGLYARELADLLPRALATLLKGETVFGAPADLG